MSPSKEREGRSKTTVREPCSLWTPRLHNVDITPLFLDGRVRGRAEVKGRSPETQDGDLVAVAVRTTIEEKCLTVYQYRPSARSDTVRSHTVRW